ncbi:hypothetical protein [Devosia sp. BK]|uniref:hypothetical protein n=1 Tax=Devosia sp. BK TaxID=2871706 RepID=UPI00293BA4BC|nr:hypothetical protein [Devosia sp. BK]
MVFVPSSSSPECRLFYRVWAAGSALSPLFHDLDFFAAIRNQKKNEKIENFPYCTKAGAAVAIQKTKNGASWSEEFCKRSPGSAIAP